jgi:hypothetical protein
MPRRRKMPGNEPRQSVKEGRINTMARHATTKNTSSNGHNYRVTTVRKPGGGEFYMVTRDGGQGPGKMFDSKRDLKNHYPNLRGFDF